MNKRSGIYDWAGPGTIRMIKLKFFHPKIDEESVMRAYDESVLKGFKETLGTTDAWITYSWGFSDATEREDREFFRAKLGNFRKLGIRTHAYVQGTNLVYAEHAGEDVWCKDHEGKLVPYHRGRKLCCPNNPRFRELILGRVADACREESDGVFVDNFHFGQFPVALQGHSTFFGCACVHCTELFKKRTGEKIPSFHDLRDGVSREYVQFRCDSTHRLAKDIKEISSAHGKEFGSNSFDQNLDARLFYGFDVGRLQDIQDYLLFENFNHPSLGKTNAHHAPLLGGKPVFIVSYKRVIGKHGVSAQRDIDAIYSESSKLGYSPCYKASEFTTDGTWHNLDPRELRPPKEVPLRARASGKRSKRKMPFAKRFAKICNAYDVQFLERVYEKRRWRKAMGWFVDALTSRHFKEADDA